MTSTESDFLPFSRPSISESDIRSVANVLRSGWITTGKKCAEFEEIFSELTGCKHAIALSSATAGMHLALHALGIGPGDKVLTPSLTWVSTVNMIHLCGATPVFCDVDRDTLMIDPESIQSRLETEQIRLIIPVHYAGACAELDTLYSLAANYQAQVIEDAAHAVGSYYRENPIGRHGTAIFSFHPIKNITTGEGGMFCTDDDALAERIRQLKFHGLGVDAYDRQQQGRSPQAEVLEPGFKYNLPDMNAALGVSQLQRLTEFNNRRKELAQLYLQQLKSVEEILPLEQPASTSTHAWHLFIVRLVLEKTSLSRDEFMAELKNRGIGSGLHFRAVHTQKFYRENYPGPVNLPNTEWNAERILSLPLFPDMHNEDVLRVVNVIKSILSKQ